MQTFENDAEYLAWIDANQDGFVVNSYRNLSPSYLQLHRASCHTISGTAPRGDSWTETDYRKTCANDRSELQRWARESIDGELNPCMTCKP